VLGSPATPAGQLDAFRNGWTVLALVALAGGAIGTVTLTSRGTQRLPT
jgi:hypothetical protein